MKYEQRTMANTMMEDECGMVMGDSKPARVVTLGMRSGQVLGAALLQQALDEGSFVTENPEPSRIYDVQLPKTSPYWNMTKIRNEPPINGRRKLDRQLQSRKNKEQGYGKRLTKKDKR